MIGASRSRTRRYGRWFSLPWPASFDFQHQGPAQKSTDQDEASEQAQAHEGQFMGDGFYDVGCNEHLEAEQQRAADTDFVDIGILLGNRLPQLTKGGPGDADYDNENAEDLDHAPHHADGGVDGRLESLECVHIVHVRASGGSPDAAYSALRRDGNRFVDNS